MLDSLIQQLHLLCIHSAKISLRFLPPQKNKLCCRWFILMLSRTAQQHTRQVTARRKGLDLQCSTSGKKKAREETLRVSTQPSPSRFLCFTTEDSPSLQSRTPATTQVTDSRVMIRQNELVEFAKRFAEEKADYEDKLDDLHKVIARLEVAERNSDNQIRQLGDRLQDKELRQKGLIDEIRGLRDEHQRLLNQNRQISNKWQQLYRTVEQTKSHNLTVAGELEVTTKKLRAASLQIERLETVAKEHAWTLGERVFEIVKLKQELEETNRLLREKAEAKPPPIVQQLESQVGILRRDNERLNRQHQEDQSYINDLNRQLRSTSSGDQQRRIGFLEQQNMRLKDRLMEQLTHSNSEVLHDNATLAIELNDKNRRIFELTRNISRLLKKSSNSASRGDYSQIETSPEGTTNQPRRNDVEDHVYRLNQQLFDLQEKLRTQQPITHFEDTTMSPNSKYQNSQLQRVGQAEELRSDSSKPKLNESSQINKLNDSDIESLCQQNDHMRIELQKLGRITAEHKALQESLRSMEGLMDSLRKENAMLKGNERRKVVIRRQLDEPKVAGSECSSEKTELQNLKQECQTLRQQLCNIRAQQVIEQNTHQSGIRAVGDSRLDRLSMNLRKLAEYSREIVYDRDNPLEFELYSTIFNKFLTHIEALESERDLLKSRGCSERKTAERQDENQ